MEQIKPDTAHGGKKLMFKRDETEQWMVEKQIGDLGNLFKEKNDSISRKF